jgi:hypothetical protein
MIEPVAKVIGEAAADEELERRPAQGARSSEKSQSEIAPEALQRHLALARFEEVRRRVVPFAEAAGYFTDKDVFRAVS